MRRPRLCPRPRALVQDGASLVSSGEAPAGTHRGQTGIGVSVLSSEGASDGLGAPPNDLDAFLRRGGLGEGRRRGAEILQARSFSSVPLKHSARPTERRPRREVIA